MGLFPVVSNCCLPVCVLGVVAEEAVLGEAVSAREEGKGGEEGGVVREAGAEEAATSLPLLVRNSWMQTWTPISRSDIFINIGFSVSPVLMYVWKQTEHVYICIYVYMQLHSPIQLTEKLRLY